MGVKIILFLVLSFCFILIKCEGEGSCDGMSTVTYKVSGNISVAQAEAGAGAEAGSVAVAAAGHVAVTAGPSAKLTVLSLQMSTPFGEILDNPPGLEKPVMFNAADRPALDNLVTEDGDTSLSIAIKKAIINMLPEQIGNDNTSYSQINDMFNLLDEGKKQIVFLEEYKDLTLVLGNTGCGKSTFTHWIANTNNILEGIELPGGDFIIQDQQGKVSNETIDSKTIFPDLVVDTYQDVAYYDMPGFSDTRSSTIEIAASYFTSSVIEHATRIKLIFLINYSSVRKGNDRSDFLLFLQHAAELINDIDKYKDSIALVITKVEYKLLRGHLVDDTEVKAGVADFLEEVKRVLQTKIIENSDTMPSNKKIFYRKAVQLINIFLTDNGSYSRIGIFRRPDDSGLLSEMDLLEVEKDEVKQIINNDLLYSESNWTDFSRTISEKSKNDVKNLIEVVERKLLLNICQLSNVMRTNFQIAIDYLRQNISALNIADDDPSEAETKICKFKEAIMNINSKINILEMLSDSIKRELSLENIPELILTQIDFMDLNVSDELNSEIAKKGKYLKFLINISDNDYTIRLSQYAWASAFQNTISNITIQINSLEHDVDELNKKIETKAISDINMISVNLIEKYNTMECNTSYILEVQQILKLENDNLSELLKISDVHDFVTKTFDALNLNMVTYAPYLPNYVTKKENVINYLKEALDNSLVYLQESQSWYQYLTKLLDEYSSNQDNQVNISLCHDLVKNITLHDKEKEAEFSSLEALLSTCHPVDYIAEYEKVKKIKLTEGRFWYLKQLLDLLYGGVTHTCGDDGKMVVKGFNVNMRDIINKHCSFELQTLEIFALNKIFIDTDLKHHSIRLAIVAPIWYVQGKRFINLDGLDGIPHIDPTASNGELPGERGKDGKSGNPGGPGGVFKGIGDQFINSSFLTISANGGDGGAGQNGGDGSWGRNGVAPDIDNPVRFLMNIGWWDNSNTYDCNIFSCEYMPIEPYTVCNDGGNGGKGGLGGAAGPPGVIELISTNSTVDLYKSTALFGSEGMSGSSGHEGRAGKPASQARVKWTWPRFWDMTRVKYEKLPECFDGHRPEFWDLNMDREEAREIPRISIELLLNDYESFVEENSVFKTAAIDFLDEIKVRFTS